LWPEVSPGYHEKDQIENRLHAAVCARSLPIRTAQREIARDWRHTFVATPFAPSEHTAAQSPSTHNLLEESTSAPAGATARCEDGTYSFSEHRSGTCSHHGGVAEWL
jgi:hypothetical protein